MINRFNNSNGPLMTLPNKRFRSRSLRVLFHLLPRRTKRLLFLSALSGKVIDVLPTRHDAAPVPPETLVKLQEFFNLCKDPSAIELPMALSGKIWGKRPIDELVCPLYLGFDDSFVRATRTARQIVAIMPCWLVYGRTRAIIDDVRQLIMSRNEIFATC